MNDGVEFIITEADSIVETSKNRSPPGASRQGLPRHNTHESMYSYRAQRHEFNGQGDERVPSAGWQAVYTEMGVDLNAER